MLSTRQTSRMNVGLHDDQILNLYPWPRCFLHGQNVINNIRTGGSPVQPEAPGDCCVCVLVLLATLLTGNVHAQTTELQLFDDL